MEPRDGDGDPRLDDAFDWEDETVETQRRGPGTSPSRPEHAPEHRTLRSDLQRLRERVPPVVLLGAGALVIVVIVVVAVLATRGGGSGEATSPVNPGSPPAAVNPEAVPPGEPVAPEPPALSPSLSVPEDVTLQEGDEGANVRTLQRALVQLGFSTEEPDGFFGERTRVAVEAFQKSASLEVDGVVGPGTASAINEVLAGRG